MPEEVVRNRRNRRHGLERGSIRPSRTREASRGREEQPRTGTDDMMLLWAWRDGRGVQGPDDDPVGQMARAGSGVPGGQAQGFT